MSSAEIEPTEIPPTVVEVVEESRLAMRAGAGGATHRDAYEADIASVSRRLAVVRAYLLPAAKRRFRADNAETVALADLTSEAERLLRGLQGTLHGQANFNAAGTVEQLHAAVSSAMERFAVAEAALTARLDRVLTPRQAAELVKKLAGAQDRSPTRPHPYTPHPPGLARLFFRASAAADRVMDSMDSRVLPRPTARPSQPPTKGNSE